MTLDNLFLDRPFIPDLTKRLHVSFGTPCSGKSTVFNAWADKFQLKLVTDDSILDQRSLLNYYLINAFERNNKSLFFHFQMEVLPLRFWQMINAPNGALVDESIFSTLAYSRALYNLNWLTEYEFKTFHNNYLSYCAFLPAEIQIFYFFCGTDTVLQRLKMRNRPIERSSYTAEYISALRGAFDLTFTELGKAYTIVEIDTEKLSFDEVVKEFGEQIFL